ncbi:MAG: hypothetical protein KC561_21115, partial [Myxococcales bacterium]|nr:hypothetical protein [Myxococcales bacterium]
MRRLAVVLPGLVFITAAPAVWSSPANSAPPLGPSWYLAQAGGEENDTSGNRFQLQESDTAGQAEGVRPSQIEATDALAAMRLFVV